MKSIRYISEALVEIDEAVVRYEGQSEGRGFRFQEAVAKAIDDIQAAPVAFARYKRTLIRECVLRKFPYVIYFLELDVAVLIVAISHGKRRQGYWRKRIRNLPS